MSIYDPKDPARIAAMAADPEVVELAHRRFLKSAEHRYSYNFSWLGRPIIQYPQDIVATQEIIWRIQPDLIVETGIAHGGSLIFYASLLELLGGDGQVLGVDIDIRAHNRAEIERHPLYKRISMIEGSSIDEQVAAQVHAVARGKRRVMVVLDSNHTHTHVLRELELYAPLVGRGSYLIVFDTVVEAMPDSFFPDRPWGQGDNPRTAVAAFLAANDRFEVDQEIENKLLLTVAPGGYLKCIKD
jgi:cephalosporin hydroxylase